MKTAAPGNKFWTSHGHQADIIQGSVVHFNTGCCIETGFQHVLVTHWDVLLGVVVLAHASTFWNLSPQLDDHLGMIIQEFHDFSWNEWNNFFIVETSEKKTHGLCALLALNCSHYLHIVDDEQGVLMFEFMYCFPENATCYYS